ncbi:MAG: Lrp/AsnC family transcriptional regulator [Chloroflexota bacterium]
MSDTSLHDLDRSLLSLLQGEFPLVEEPYTALGLRLGVGEGDIIAAIERLKAEGVVRLISPVLDSRRLGYRSTLVAMGVPADQLDTATSIISQNPGVSHGYERDHRFNIWFTLAVPPAADMEAELEKLASPIAAEAVFDLPALKMFKIRAYFAMKGGQPAPSPAVHDGRVPGRVELSRTDRRLINELQQDLPLISRPFAGMAARLDMNVDQFLAGCRSLLERGVMRRFGAAVNHRRAGFGANAMTCWVAPREKVAAAGQDLASLPEVSHCYERETNPLWQYNLFAMIHGHTAETCREIADDASRRTGLKEWVVLFSTREFKKERIKYLV